MTRFATTILLPLHPLNSKPQGFLRAQVPRLSRVRQQEVDDHGGVRVSPLRATTDVSTDYTYSLLFGKWDLSAAEGVKTKSK